MGPEEGMEMIRGLGQPCSEHRLREQDLLGLEKGRLLNAALQHLNRGLETTSDCCF